MKQTTFQQTLDAISQQMAQDNKTVKDYALDIATKVFDLKKDNTQTFTSLYRQYLVPQCNPSRKDLFFAAFCMFYSIYYRMLENIFTPARCSMNDSKGQPWIEGESLDDFPCDIQIY